MEGARRRRRRHKSYSSIVLLFILIILLVVILNSTLAKYSSSGKSGTAIDVAYFIVEETTISDTITLKEMVPGDDGYTYTFSIANYNAEGKRAEVEIEYEIAIRMTTNLPLKYELYENSGTQNLFSNLKTEKDEDGTYFKTITLDKEYFSFENDCQNIYTLKISFPSEYNSSQYQDILEAIEITIDAKQRK